jgi:hypothetical protein
MASEPTSTITAKSSPSELATLTPERLAALVKDARPVEGPITSSSIAFILQSINDIAIAFGRPKPVILPDGTIPNLAVTETTAIVHMSMLSFKDLYLAMGKALSAYESTHGEIITDTMKQNAATNKK